MELKRIKSFESFDRIEYYLKLNGFHTKQRFLDIYDLNTGVSRNALILDILK